MTTIADYFAQAQLSLAAYALDLQQGMSGTSVDRSIYIASLKAAGMSQTQADAFANTYIVVSQSELKGSASNYFRSNHATSLTY